jgi:hypothetical protein
VKIYVANIRDGLAHLIHARRYEGRLASCVGVWACAIRGG